MPPTAAGTEATDVTLFGIPTKELFQTLVKWGLGACFASVLLWFTLDIVNEKLDAAVQGHVVTASLLEKHQTTTAQMSEEVKALRQQQGAQNKAIIRLLQLGCLSTAVDYTQRRDCQAVQEE
jgi:mevalonate kinase